jgi:outer membrane protein OmpA-like peptidoglycan-associated protein
MSLFSAFDKLTLPGRIIVLGLLAGGAFFGIKYGADMLPKSAAKSVTLTSIDLPTAPANAKSTVPASTVPTSRPAVVSGPELRVGVWAWNAGAGLMYAVGDKAPTQGSLMAKYGVNVKLTRIDDSTQMQNEMVKFAKEYQKNPNTTEGIQAVNIMGTGVPSFLAGLNPQLEKLGATYKAVVVAVNGFSDGEDQVMAPTEWRANPSLAKGKTLVGVLRDGDIHLGLKWAADNNIAINPDETTYDADALNFINASDYIDAANKYVAGFSEERPVVAKGVRTGAKHTVTCDAVTTWTPGDVIVAEKKGGLVTLVSTKEYRSQMPQTVVMISKWAQDNKPTVINYLKASFEGSDQVKSYSAALQFAGEASAKVYGEKDGAYWVKYFKGVPDAKDKQGMRLSLGGSRVCNLADNLNYFGLNSGDSVNTFKIIYTTFGTIDSKLYPKVMPTFPAADDIMDLSYLKELASKTTNMAAADLPTYNASKGIGRVVSARAWSIEFKTGSAQISPKSIATLQQLAEAAVGSEGLLISIEGHTDNVGTANGNFTLSQARATAVRNWLQNRYPSAFPTTRMIVSGKGQDEPVAENTTEAGRAKNRRVVIEFGR